MISSAFPDSKELAERLLKDEPLTSAEIRRLLPRLRYLTQELREDLRIRLDAESIIELVENTAAIKSFDQASRKLTKWLIGFTIALVALTVVLAAPILVHGVMWLVHRW